MIESQSELIDKISVLKKGEDIDPILFAKLLTGYFSLGYYIKEDKSSYVYDAKLVSKLLENIEPFEMFDSSATCYFMLKYLYKVVDKQNTDRTINLCQAIAESYQNILDIHNSINSIKQIRSIRDLTPLEEAKLDNMLKEITTAISTRNNILKVLEDFINYDFNDPVGMSALVHVISDDGLNKAKKAQRFMNTVFRWQLPF